MKVCTRVSLLGTGSLLVDGDLRRRRKAPLLLRAFSDGYAPPHRWGVEERI
jgi:hypothetical protein